MHREFPALGMPPAFARALDNQYLHDQGLPVSGGPVHQGLAAAYRQVRPYVEDYRQLNVRGRLTATSVEPLGPLLELLSQRVGYAVTLEEFSDDLLGGLALVRNDIWTRRCPCAAEFPPQSCRNEDGLDHYLLAASSTLIDAYYGEDVTAEGPLGALDPATAEAVKGGIQAGAWRLRELLALVRREDPQPLEALDTHALLDFAAALEEIR